jgi:NADH-quinone oxidoreductase subunit G
MSETKKIELITIYIDGKPVQVAPGTNVIEAARQAGTEIPHYCYHSKLSIAGNCRMCLVEMGNVSRDRATGKEVTDDQGRPIVMWSPKPAIACATNATPGLHIKTSSPLVKECREGVMEFLLVNHPLDCPICDQAGECRLQEYATDYGRGSSRYVERKNVKPKRTQLGPRVMLDDERCILCSRCIRFCREVIKEDVLGFIDRGSYSTLTCYPGKELTHNYSLNTVDLCPVGALTSIDFRFKMRTWFLKETSSICTESSVGVNTTVCSREGTIYRILPRENDAVNDSWMSDSGRMRYKDVETESRLTRYSSEGKPIVARDAIAAAKNLLGNGQGVAIVASGKASVEEQWLLKKLSQRLANAPVYLISHVYGEGDGLLISADHTPNVRGALVTGLTDTLPEKELGELRQAINTGKIKTVLVINEDLKSAGIDRECLNQVAVVYMGTHYNETSQVARLEVPGCMVFEKTGTFINQQFRLQKFNAAIPGPFGVISDLEFLSELSGISGAGDLDTLWAQISADCKLLSGIRFSELSATGQLIDGAAFSHLPFCESAGMHFQPLPVSVANLQR